MKRSGRMGELAAEMAVALNEPSESLQSKESVPAREKHKTAQTVLINNKNTEETIDRTISASPTSLPRDIQLNPPHGEKDSFERMSITLPPEIRQRLLDESNNRKKKRSPDWSISVIVREALVAYLK